MLNLQSVIWLISLSCRGFVEDKELYVMVLLAKYLVLRGGSSSYLSWLWLESTTETRRSAASETKCAVEFVAEKYSKWSIYMQ
ncbi:hypothetical protein Scep_017311 [Stephania cephalantha]|uniref:Uncharacterized protein n=1 Tax=Stephania cephalantha TaxID=152367 RepID=A0AAP0IP94_9MAGN